PYFIYMVNFVLFRFGEFCVFIWVSIFWCTADLLAKYRIRSSSTCHGSIGKALVLCLIHLHYQKNGGPDLLLWLSTSLWIGSGNVRVEKVAIWIWDSGFRISSISLKKLESL
ncbi:hypothetical protein ACJX0J_025529, partial [Zea mays]